MQRIPLTTLEPDVHQDTISRVREFDAKSIERVERSLKKLLAMASNLLDFQESLRPKIILW